MIETTNAILYIITSCLVAGWIIYASHRTGRISTPAYFILISIAFSITGAIFVLAVSNPAVQFGGSNIAYIIANCIYFVMVAWLLRTWIQLVEWELSESSAKQGSRISLANYFAFVLLSLVLIAAIVLYLELVIDSGTFGILFLVCNFAIVFALFTQTMAVLRVYKSEASGVTGDRKRQLRFVLILTAILFVVELIYTLTYWFPFLAPVSTVIAFLWLIAIMWPGSLAGFDKERAAEYPLSGNAQQRPASNNAQQRPTSNNPQQQRASPFV